jgi:adenylylsulfate kinase
MGVSTVIALVSPLGFERQQARDIVGDGFVEVFCNASLEACEGRDTHGLYERARKGEIANVTGIDAPYEEPQAAEIVLDTVNDTVEVNVQKIIDHLTKNGLLAS